MTRLLILIAAATCVGLGLLAPAAAGDAADLAAPVAVKVGGIDLAADAKNFGDYLYRDDNSFPWVGDFDGDGKHDLLVDQGRRGKSDGGHLRIYRNLEGKAQPRLAEPIWFHDQVPTGHTPLG
jgi:hypothetical protein